MFDGIYQSLIVWFMPYSIFASGGFNTASGLHVNDSKRVGMYAAHTSILVVNIYILMNTYRWDWLTVTIASISALLIFFWTGVYTAGTLGYTFYKAAPEVYSSASFWAVTCLSVVICLLPRFTGKSFQKLFLPRDVDIIREQIRLGKFDYLKDSTKSTSAGGKYESSSSSSDEPKPRQGNGGGTVPDDERPIYPPSVAPTATTHNPRSHNGSDGTDYTGHRWSVERPNRVSLERPRPSFDRFKTAMDRTRPSYEASRDFTTAALLTRVESSHDGIGDRRR
jgi:phospholipid-translocating ATPase